MHNQERSHKSVPMAVRAEATSEPAPATLSKITQAYIRERERARAAELFDPNSSLNMFKRHLEANMDPNKPRPGHGVADVPPDMKQTLVATFVYESDDPPLPITHVSLFGVPLVIGGSAECARNNAPVSAAQTLRCGTSARFAECARQAEKYRVIRTGTAIVDAPIRSTWGESLFEVSPVALGPATLGRPTVVVQDKLVPLAVFNECTAKLCAERDAAYARIAELESRLDATAPNHVLAQAFFSDTTYTVFASTPSTIMAAANHTPSDVKLPAPTKPFPAGALTPKPQDQRRIGS